MSTPQLAESFIDLLRKSELLSSAQIDGAIERLGLFDQPSVKEMARALVRDGLVTRFQAERLLEGRYRGFFIDRFKVLEILGAGGMACLYLAQDTQTGARVALKVLSDKHKADAGMLTRLKLEALAGKKLDHPGIVHTYGMHQTVDVFGEVYYLVMDYVEGVNLEELINIGGPIPWRQACDFMRQAAEALAHAHSVGMIHRDVKPGNLLVDHQGVVRILDFGLCLHDTHADADEFSLAMIFGHSCLGTADYVSPEQSRDSYAVDPRTDVYSLGCTLYVALSGKLPFPMPSSTEKLEGHRNHTALPLCSIARDIPAELAAVVEKMMAKSSLDRFQSMTEVAAALAPFAQAGPVVFDFPKMLARRAKDARRRFATLRKRSSSAGSSVTSSSWVIRGLPSASTKRLPQASADTTITPETPSAETAVSLMAPYAKAAEEASLSRPEVSVPASRGPVLVPLDNGARIPLAGDCLVIGRDEGCDIRLPFTAVSGRHCELRFDGTLWRVIDLKSKNGVQVNGQNVTDHLLLPGDNLTIARAHQFRVEYSAFAPLATGRMTWWAILALLAAGAILGALYIYRLIVS